MAGRPSKKAPAPAPVKPKEEFVDDDETFDDEPPNIEVDLKSKPTGMRSRDWRDVEKYREQRELNRLLGDRDDDFFGAQGSPKKKKK